MESSAFWREPVIVGQLSGPDPQLSVATPSDDTNSSLTPEYNSPLSRTAVKSLTGPSAVNGEPLERVRPFCVKVGWQISIMRRLMEDSGLSKRTVPNPQLNRACR
jgi:hypothetical protein